MPSAPAGRVEPAAFFPSIGPTYVQRRDPFTGQNKTPGFIWEDRAPSCMAVTSGGTFTVIMTLGAVLFISLAVTAILGVLASREKVPFTWHFTMAIVSIAILIIHGAIAMAYFLGI